MLLYISASIIPSITANSVHVMKMCQALSFEFDDVRLICGRPMDNGSGVDIYKLYGVREVFKLYRIIWPNIRGWGYFYSILSAFYALFLRPQVVLSRNIVGALLASYVCKRVMLELHAPVRDESLLLRLAFNHLLKRSTLIKLVVITEALKRHFITEAGVDDAMLLVAPDGADVFPADVVPVKLASRQGILFKVGYVGHLYKGKGMEVVIPLSAQCHWAEFHIVGGTAEDISFWKSQCQPCANIFFHGHVPHNDTLKYLAAFDVFLLPNQRIVGTSGRRSSDIGEWTSPLKAFEYMSVGKPILCSDLPVLREVFTNGRNAIMCDPGDACSWIRALESLRDAPSLQQKIGMTARRDLENKFSWRARAKLILIGSKADTCR